MRQKTNSTVTVDLGVLKENISTLRSFLNKGTKIMAVVKANAYGHGAVKVAEAISLMVDAFAVNDIQEGIELRESAINKAILIFGVPEESFAGMYKKYDLTATVSSEKHFTILPAGTSYHLNFDTGMGRLGFYPDDAEKVARLAAEHEELSCTGIYSHFASAHKPESDSVQKQYELFQEIRKHFPPKLTTHICNTGGTVFHKLKQFDMVRLGIGMYGYSPGEAKIEGLKPVLKWGSRLVQVKRVKKGKAVSYGSIWKAPSDGYVGMIPVGYYDGLRRNLSGQFSVRIGTKSYKVVGIITMNFCMVYLGDDYYEPGTEAELIYPENDAEDWAEKIRTISYEILTGIDRSIPREYIS
ncbi:MAG TPA: alanine racemase [Balneolaceae bacterium]|nr:alanine racemase [Balneolaceae bacterium]